MKVVILTESLSGTAAHHLDYLVSSGAAEVAMVVYSHGKKQNPKRFYLKKWKKIVAIGIGGVLNGIRMRAWYGRDVYSMLKTTDLRKNCEKKGIPFRETERTNSRETMELMAASGAELGLSLGNGYIARKIFSIPARGMVNIHHEILPEYQNAQSIIWQIYNLSEYTGYTIHKISATVDGGDILYQEKLPIVFKDRLRETVAATYVQLLEASARGLATLLRQYDEYEKNAIVQAPGTSYTTPTLWQYLRIRRNHQLLKGRKRSDA